MALEVREVKAGPRRPAGGYSHNLPTMSGSPLEIISERAAARPLKPGPVLGQWDGKKVAAPAKPTTDPAIDLQSRTITS